MSIRNEGRGLHATLALWVATVCTAVAALLAVTAQSASAYKPCPGPAPSGGILNWQTLWPTGGANAKGVTLCHGYGSVFSKGYLQMVDLNDGAKVRLVSTIDTLSSPAPGPLQPYTTYDKRTVDDWYSYIRGGGVSTPTPSRLFSTTNASFFKTTDAAPTTWLPFPHRYNHVHETWGTTMFDDHWSDGTVPVCPDPEYFDYCARKKLLRVGTTSETPQKVGVGTMLTIYDAQQAELMLRDGHWSAGPTWPDAADATVGFDPLTQFGESSRRNYVGRYGSVLYLFTSDTEYTNAEVNSLMQEIQPGMSVMQLDGGGSAQFHSDYGWMDSNYPIFDREIPDVIAIYRAP